MDFSVSTVPAAQVLVSSTSSGITSSVLVDGHVKCLDDRRTGALGSQARFEGALPAEVIGPPLQHGKAERPRGETSQEGEVLGRKLVLERLGRGRHHDRSPCADHRHQIRE